MKRVVVVCALIAASTLVASAEADTCWQLSPGGNVVQLRFLAVGPSPNRFLITGVENVFEDRAVDGSASFGFHEPGTLRLGFTDHANTTGFTSHLECNAKVNLSDGNGTWVCWKDVLSTWLSGDFVLTPDCVGGPGPDLVATR
jgi:hypothetical protein